MCQDINREILSEKWTSLHLKHSPTVQDVVFCSLQISLNTAEFIINANKPCLFSISICLS